MLMSWRLSVGSWKPGSWNETNNQLWCSCNRGVRGWEWNCERQSQTEVSYERQHVRSRAAFSEASLQTRRDAFALSDTKCMQTLGNSWCNRENDTEWFCGYEAMSREHFIHSCWRLCLKTSDCSSDGRAPPNRQGGGSIPACMPNILGQDTSPELLSDASTREWMFESYTEKDVIEASCGKCF